MIASPPLAPPSSRFGFTMIELTLVVGIVATLATMTILALNPQRQMLVARDSQRKSLAVNIERAFTQFYLNSANNPNPTFRNKFPSESGGYVLPTTSATAMPICKDGYAPVSWSLPSCISTLQFAGTGGYISSVTRDSSEVCPQFSGYSVWLNKGRPTVIAVQLGRATGAKGVCLSGCPTASAYTTATCISVPGACGDGTTQSGETCDDGNTANGDGCSSVCAIESGYACTGTPSACYNCTNGVCTAGDIASTQCTDVNEDCENNCTSGFCSPYELTSTYCTAANEDCDNNCRDRYCSPYEVQQNSCNTYAHEDCYADCGPLFCSPIKFTSDFCTSFGGDDCNDNCSDGVCSTYEENNTQCDQPGRDCYLNSTDGLCSPLEDRTGAAVGAGEDCNDNCSDGVCSLYEQQNSQCPETDCWDKCGDFICSPFENTRGTCYADCDNTCSDGLCSFIERDMGQCTASGEDCE